MALSVSLPRLGGVPLLATATKVGIVYYDLVKSLLQIIKYEMAKGPHWLSLCLSLGWVATATKVGKIYYYLALYL